MISLDAESGFAMTVFLPEIRDVFSLPICWSKKPECECQVPIAVFHIVFGAMIQMACPLCIDSVLMFFWKQDLLYHKSSIWFYCNFYLVVVIPSYLICFFVRMHMSPQSILSQHRNSIQFYLHLGDLFKTPFANGENDP